MHGQMANTADCRKDSQPAAATGSNDSVFPLLETEWEQQRPKASGTLYHCQQCVTVPQLLAPPALRNIQQEGVQWQHALSPVHTQHTPFISTKHFQDNSFPP